MNGRRTFLGNSAAAVVMAKISSLRPFGFGTEGQETIDRTTDYAGRSTNTGAPSWNDDSKSRVRTSPALTLCLFMSIPPR
jgi:hypothetical protein